MTQIKPDWFERAQSLRIPKSAIVNGEHRHALSGKTFNCHSSIDGRLLSPIPACDHRDVALAVTAARQVFDAGHWSREAPRQRKRRLLAFAELIKQHKEELALLETLDMGKPISESLKVDVGATVNCIAWHAEAIDKIYGEIAPTHHGELGLITREPLGVIGAIVPWNFPMLMAAWKLGPALATGNSVILKPSEKSPLTALRLGELALEAGIPPGVFNVLPGLGPEAGEAIAAHGDVDGIAFTGSTATGKHLMAVAASTNMKRCFVECGGKSPNIIFPDAPDLDRAATASAMAIFYNQGEVCTAASRLLIHRSLQDVFIEKIIAASKQLQPGHPLDAKTTMGAIVDARQMQTILTAIDRGKAEGARLVCGGEAVMTGSGGHYLPPTVFTEVDNTMSIARNEIFGPVLACIGFDTEEDAIALANHSDYGLAAGVWTRDIHRAHRVASRIRAGSVWVNYYDAGDMTAPFGGYKQSGNGRDKSHHALEKYTEVKATWVNLQE
ncbi:MAG: aldehyde dehydrogenase [Cellvibrionaceae bacterium]|nr:aldehyde dehydrogenase [Cellvibrionaceae bacterium]